MPGHLGHFYAEECDGPLLVMGKPAGIIYRIALQKLGLRNEEVLAVGDSMEHDIAGAVAAGVDTLFVAGGIHEKDFLEEELGGLRDIDGRAVVRVAAAAGLAAAPTFAMGHLRW